MTLTIDEMQSFCKRKGFVFPSAEIYGGFAGFFDYGPLGCELKNNIKSSWWHEFVQMREDIVGIDGTTVNHPQVWIASGHVANFTDILTHCAKCGERYRADVLVEDTLKIPTAGMNAAQLGQIIESHGITCHKCKGKLNTPEPFNLMFQTHVGPKRDEESIAYLRPETAQVIFTEFKNVVDTGRVKLPFGIAQMGRAYRNEISPRNFLFRCREFEQMEIEYFVHPDKLDDCPYINEVSGHAMLVWSADMQATNEPHCKLTVKDLIDKKICKYSWHAYWLARLHQWFVSMGATADKFRIRQHVTGEKAHYATDTWDLEYEFPFGWKELTGISNRGDYDLKAHMKASGKDLSLYDEETKQKVVPHVIAEPSQGVDRAFLVFLYDAYHDDKERGNTVLKLHPRLAPVKLGVFPLLSNREELTGLARQVFDTVKHHFTAQYDRSGSVGRRYARADEIGVPYCLTIDFDSVTRQDVTIRDRDSTKQVRVPIKDLTMTLHRLFGGLPFDQAGTPVEAHQ